MTLTKYVQSSSDYTPEFLNSLSEETDSLNTFGNGYKLSLCENRGKRDDTCSGAPVVKLLPSSGLGTLISLKGGFSIAQGHRILEGLIHLTLQNVTVIR
ncbi:hypothetical protein TNCV_3140221 [Trichonephila clavipes]|nr:hypothetical protein TNCV_3140221 [Trichonephila clavipes]